MNESFILRFFDVDVQTKGDFVGTANGDSYLIQYYSFHIEATQLIISNKL